MQQDGRRRGAQQDDVGTSRGMHPHSVMLRVVGGSHVTWIAVVKSDPATALRCAQDDAVDSIPCRKREGIIAPVMTEVRDQIEIGSRDKARSRFLV